MRTRTPIAIFALMVALTLVLVLATGCRRRAAGIGPAPGTDAVLEVTVKGDVFAMETTYTPTGRSVSLQAASMVYIGRSPNKRKFYLRKDAPIPPPEIYLLTGKSFYDVWAPAKR